MAKIYEMNIHIPFIVNGVIIWGLKDLKRRVEIRGSKFGRELRTQAKEDVRNSNARLHIGVLYEDYPCFDSEDSLNEDREYQNYILRGNPITEKDMENVLENCKPEMDFCYVNANTPENLAPMIYYKGEGTKMYLIK